MLNQSKGPAVHSLRAQADKSDYSKEMRRVLEEQDNLDIRQMEVTDIIADDPNESGIRKIKGVQTYSGAIYPCKAVILCTGTYLKARCIYGEISTQTGPNGLQSANYLTDSLKSLGIKMYRFKTGTPARIDKNSIDFTKMEEQKGDERVVPFSFTTDPEDVQIDQVSCWLTYTNETTHEIIRENLVGWPFGVFLMKQFSENIPTELLESAKIDGCGEIRTFWNVAFPIVKPGFAALAIFTFINTWNDYFMQLVMLTSRQNLTISLGVATMQAEMATNYGLIMAGAAMAAVPIVTVFLVFQKSFTQGITMGAVKG